MYDGPLQELIDALSRLPGIGPKGAQRIAFHILDAPAEEANELADALREVKEKAKFCKICFNVS
ncbi:recombination protein RecR, partial [Barnesiella sp. GGCC_0306]|nr:recombination protein RecR [Barnesiella sp. GGCC_0306]